MLRHIFLRRTHAIKMKTLSLCVSVIGSLLVVFHYLFAVTTFEAQGACRRLAVQQHGDRAIGNC